MRPVNRGECPCNDSGEPRNFYPDYVMARGELIERLGEYCSFCESRIQSGLHVEHVLPKRPTGHQGDIPGRVGDWNNFLLACVNCNSHKSNTEFADEQCMFPDRCDTFSALTYGEGGQVSPSKLLSQSDWQRAMNLINLVGLNASPATPRDLRRRSDRRWSNRFTAWQIAKECRKDVLAQINNACLIDHVIKIALADGHWSVWMSVFKDLPEFVEKLISKFPGTESSYFNHAKGA